MGQSLTETNIGSGMPPPPTPPPPPPGGEEVKKPRHPINRPPRR
ncbi:hypothetical protein ABIC65_004335, partial [Sphingomonas trueperi]